MSKHLATAQILRDLQSIDLIFLTHDQQLATGVQALGFEVLGI